MTSPSFAVGPPHPRDAAAWRELYRAYADFDQEAVTAFTTPEHASLVLGGRLCQVTGFNEVDYARIKRSLEGAA